MIIFYLKSISIFKMNNVFIMEYIDILDKRKVLTRVECIGIWSNYVESKLNEMKINYTINELKTLGKNDLVLLCQDRNLNNKGTKSTLINRLINPPLFEEMKSKEIIQIFIDLLSDRYNIDNIEYMSYWTNGIEDDIEEEKIYTTRELKKMKKSELLKLVSDDISPEIKKTKKTLLDYLLSLKPKFREIDKDIHKQIKNHCPILHIQRNKYNNYEHSETHFIFDELTHHVIGKQKENEIEQLNITDIELCKQLNFKYKLPLKFN